MLAALFEEATMPNLSIDPGDSYQSVPSAKSGRLKLPRTRGNNSATSLGRAAAQSVFFDTAPSLSPSCRPVSFSQLRKNVGCTGRRSQRGGPPELRPTCAAPETPTRPTGKTLCWSSTCSASVRSAGRRRARFGFPLVLGKEEQDAATGAVGVGPFDLSAGSCAP